MECGSRELGNVFLDTASSIVLEVHDPVQLRAVDSSRVMNESFGVGHGEHLGSHLNAFFSGILRHVARSGDDSGLALEIFTFCRKHLCSEVNGTIAGRFRSDQRSSPIAAFACKDACKLIAQTLVLTKEIADFTTANADVSCGDICVGTNVSRQFRHETLAKTHHLSIRFPLWIEIGTAFSAAHGQRG